MTPEASLFEQILACWREWSIITDPGDEDADPVALKRIGNRRNALFDAADRLPTAPENVPVKALALAWLEYVDPLGERSGPRRL
nr:hypothetical protein [Methylobacterium sp. L1A1]